MNKLVNEKGTESTKWVEVDREKLRNLVDLTTYVEVMSVSKNGLPCNEMLNILLQKMSIAIMSLKCYDDCYDMLVVDSNVVLREMSNDCDLSKFFNSMKRMGYTAELIRFLDSNERLYKEYIHQSPETEEFIRKMKDTTRNEGQQTDTELLEADEFQELSEEEIEERKKFVFGFIDYMLEHFPEEYKKLPEFPSLLDAVNCKGIDIPF